jgi:UPF0716 protein FxsA
MAWLYLLALLVIPVADAMLLLFVFGPWLGAVETVALVVITALLGMVFVRAEGRRTLRKIQRSLARGEPPTDELVDGGLLIAAGAFLLTPGFVTDLVGLVLVVPVTRYPIRLALKKFVVTPYVDEKTGGFATGRIYMGGFPDEDAGGFPDEDDRDDGDDDYVDVDYEER